LPFFDVAAPQGEGAPAPFLVRGVLLLEIPFRHFQLGLVARVRIPIRREARRGKARFPRPRETRRPRPSVLLQNPARAPVCDAFLNPVVPGAPIRGLRPKPAAWHPFE